MPGRFRMLSAKGWVADLRITGRTPHRGREPTCTCGQLPTVELGSREDDFSHPLPSLVRRDPDLDNA